MCPPSRKVRGTHPPPNERKGALSVEVGSDPAKDEASGTYEQMAVAAGDRRARHHAERERARKGEERSLLDHRAQAISDVGRKAAQAKRRRRPTDLVSVLLPRCAATSVYATRR